MYLYQISQNMIEIKHIVKFFFLNKFLVWIKELMFF